MAITTWAKVQSILELGAAKEAIVTALIELCEGDYLAIRNKPFDIGRKISITAGATSAGNITVNLDGIDYVVEVAAEDGAALVARKIKVGMGTLYYYDISAVGAVVIFKNKYEDTELALSFVDTDLTGVAAVVSTTQLIYPDGAEMTAIDMINYRLGKRVPGVSSERLGDHSISYTQTSGYPDEIIKRIRRYAGWA